MIQLLFSLVLFNGISGKIQGVVRDEATGHVISYADVMILNTEIGAATDDNGNFYILNVPAGRYTLEISCLGYQTKQVENVLVEIDQTYRLKATLKPSAIEMSPVVISGSTPAVKKDMVGSTYIIRKEEISTLPIDYLERLIAFQPSVANVDTALHVRGGRATEVLYLIDNVSIIDPQTGDPAINISKGIIDEIIFLPGGFDAEYGRAMSGVVNLITEHPRDKLSGQVFGKTETIMPFYYDFGYQDYQASLHLPVSRKFKGLFAADLMHTDDWDPRLFILPHKQRDDYALYSKWLYAPSGKLNLSLSGAKSRTQFDRYDWRFLFHLDHWRSDLRQSDLQTLNVNYLPETKKLIQMTLSRLYTETKAGVRVEESLNPFENFTYRPYNSLRYPFGGYMNPYGAYLWYFRIEGDYPAYIHRNTQVLKSNLSMTWQIQKNQEMKAGFEYTINNLHSFVYFLSSDTLKPILDTFRYKPREYAAYVQNTIDYEGLYAKLGCRFESYDNGISGKRPNIEISPRLGFSFMVTDKFLFRANFGKYVQPPSYGAMYNYYRIMPFPGYLSYLWGYIQAGGEGLIGNPDLKPEKTICYEIGLQGALTKTMNVTFNSYYKDFSDLIGARFIICPPLDPYLTYLNVEYGNVKGFEAIVDLSNRIISGKISYSLSWARGTSSYASNILNYYIQNGLDTIFTIPEQEYYLDFDQRHRFFIQGIITLPQNFQANLFCFFGSGYPYTPPGLEGKTADYNISRMTFRRQIDLVLSRGFKKSRFTINANLELINLLDLRYQLKPVITMIPLDKVKVGDYKNYISLTQGLYHPAADFNHDGLISPREYYIATRKLLSENSNYIEAYSSPRRARIGLTINF